MGRPSDYTTEIADEIVSRIIDGETLVEICQSEHLPSRGTVYRWMDERPDFETRCARAREAQAEYMDHLILTEAKACTVENAQAAKVKISAYQWRAGKLDRGRFGDRMHQEHSGSLNITHEQAISELE